jgi:hypothetical protein
MREALELKDRIRSFPQAAQLLRREVGFDGGLDGL